MTSADHAGHSLPVSEITVSLTPEVETPVTAAAFAELGLHPLLVRALADQKFENPTPVQAQAIPAALQGSDLLVSSQTGSGKTAAFLLPALQRLVDKPVPPRTERAPRGRGRRPRPEPAKPMMVVLTPTRELAQQVTTATTLFAKYLQRVVCTSIVGGMAYPRQLDMLAKMPDILVATPGRLLDHMGSGRIDLSDLAILVFDEADRMLDMGFADDIDMIVGKTPENRQTLMFSATMGDRIGELAGEMLRDPVRISIEQKQFDYHRIEQRLHFADDMSHKQKLLEHILTDESLQQAIIFTGTKAEADELAYDLSEKGYSASALHGDMKQSLRNRTLQNLRRGEIQVLVATDVAARGIDVPTISHVVNYALPKHSEDYIHRIGRTGRAGRNGVAINLVQHGERYKWKKIERLLPVQVEASVVDGLEPQHTPKPRTRNGSGGFGAGKERWSRDRKDRQQQRFERRGPRDDQPRFLDQQNSREDFAPRFERQERFGQQENRSEGRFERSSRPAREDRGFERNFNNERSFNNERQFDGERSSFGGEQRRPRSVRFDDAQPRFQEDRPRRSRFADQNQGQSQYQGQEQRPRRSREAGGDDSRGNQAPRREWQAERPARRRHVDEWVRD